MERLYLVLRQSLFSYRALFGWLRPSYYVIMKILEPAAQVMFFSLLGAFAGKDPAYYALGNAVRIASVSGLFGCASVMMNERWSGTLQSVVASPTPLAQTFVTRSLLQVFDGLVTVIVGFAVGAFLFGLDFSRVSSGWLIFALLITSFSITCLGMLVATFGLVGIDINLISNLVFYSLIILCGVNFPVESLPAPIQVLSNILPLTHGLAGIRSLFAGSVEGVPLLLFMEALIGGLYGFAGYTLFRRAEYRARIHGTLDLV